MNQERWKLIEDAVKLKDDETANEHIKTIAAALDALASIVESHREEFVASRIRNMGPLTD